VSCDPALTTQCQLRRNAREIPPLAGENASVGDDSLVAEDGLALTALRTARGSLLAAPRRYNAFNVGQLGIIRQTKLIY